MTNQTYKRLLYSFISSFQIFGYEICYTQAYLSKFLYYYIIRKMLNKLISHSLVIINSDDHDISNLLYLNIKCRCFDNVNFINSVYWLQNVPFIFLY